MSKSLWQRHMVQGFLDAVSGLQKRSVTRHLGVVPGGGDPNHFVPPLIVALQHNASIGLPLGNRP